MKKLKLVVIDDEIDLSNFVSELAQQEGFETNQFNSGSSFINSFDKKADIIVLDLMMPDVDGIEVIRYLSKYDCNSNLILMSGLDSEILHSAEQLASEQNLNVIGVLNKPFRHVELRKLLNSLSLVPKSSMSKYKTKEPSLFELEKAINNDELVIHYQPKIGLKDAFVAVEALVRWNHPLYGLLQPNKFIPLAEEKGLIDDLTWVIMDKSMHQCSLWNQLGMSIIVSINMSARTFKDLNIPERIEKMIQKHKISASQIILEVTETALMEELITSLDILTRLRLKGIRLSIDDFGTGYSSLVQLHRAPFSEIKIDQSFVLNMSKDKESKVIAETVIALGHKLGMSVVAEGIETKAIFEELKRMDCDIAQGYFISKPKPAEIITPWLLDYIENNVK